jgi:polyisoprenyl-teichoic acid--peptidoglycan teichoic acid transferase
VRVTQKLPPGTVTFMVLGNDFRPGGGYRTDVMMLVAVNTGKGTGQRGFDPARPVCHHPGWADQRINTAFPRGGFPDAGGHPRV